jgi:hypothetical protein
VPWLHDRDNNVIGRRAALLGAATLAARPARAAPALPRNLAFQLVRHGTPIGRHSVVFTQNGDVMTVRVTVDALVTLLSIPIVRYAHRATETWQGGRLTALSGTTDKNGEHEWMSAQRTGAGLVVTGSKTASYIAPEHAVATSYWNKRMVDAPLISLEDGVLLRPKVAEHPAGPVKLASGAMIEADRYSLTGPFHVDVWYDAANTWASLALPVPDGSTVHYERL